MRHAAPSARSTSRFQPPIADRGSSENKVHNLFMSPSPLPLRSRPVFSSAIPSVRMHSAARILSLAFAALATASTSPPHLRRTSGPSCHSFKVPITASAMNSEVVAPFNGGDPSLLLGQLSTAFLASGESALGNFLGGGRNVSGTYNINMLYCKPEKHDAERAKSLQCALLAAV